MAKDPEKNKFLLEALNQNWLHARHIENQRLHLLQIYSIIAAAIIAFLASSLTSPYIIIIGVTLLIFLSYLSFVAYFAFLKWNAEFKNHISAIQWISINLELMQEARDDKKKMFEEEITKYIKYLPQYAYINETYMALPIPLSFRIHNWIFTEFPKNIASISLSIAFGLFINEVLVYTFDTGVQNYISHNYSIIISAISIIIIFVISSWYCSKINKEIKTVTEIILNFRRPTEFNENSNP